MAESTRTVNLWTPTRKAAVILDLLRGGDAVELARTHGLSQAQLFAWRDRFLEGGHAAVSTVIPGMRWPEHAEANCAASDGKPLSADLLATLRTHAWVRNFYQ